MVAAMIEATLRCAALFAVTWAVIKAFRLRDLGAEKNIWTLVVAASLVMPLLSSALETLAPWLHMLPSRPLSLLSAAQVTAPEATEARIAQLCWIIYLLGVAVWMVRFATGLWMGARLRRRAVPVPALSTDSRDVRTTLAMRGPASFGSTILLPAGYASWDSPMLAAVLAHEEAHIRNQDCYRIWLATLHRAVFWFNPLAHVLYRRLQLLCELTSDEAAAAAIGNRAAYALVLRRVASAPPRFAATVAMATPSTLARRLETLGTESTPRCQLGRRQNAVLIAAMAVFVALSAAPSEHATALAAQGIARLEFYLVDEHSDAYTAQRTGQLPPGDRLFEGRDGHPVLVKRQVVVKPTQVNVTPTDNGVAVQIRLDSKSAASLLRTTAENIGNRMAMVYVEPSLPAHGGNQKQVSAPGRIISDAVIRGAFGSQFQVMGLTPEEAKTLASQIGHKLPN